MIGKHFAPFMFNFNFDIDVQKLFTNTYMHIYELINDLKNTCHEEWTWDPFIKWFSVKKKKKRVIYISFILDTKLKFRTIKPSRHTPYVYITYTGMHIFCYISIFSYLAYCLRQLTQSLRHLSTLYTLLKLPLVVKNRLILKLSWSFNLFFMISFAIITIQFNSIYCPELYSSSEYKV